MKTGLWSLDPRLYLYHFLITNKNLKSSYLVSPKMSSHVYNDVAPEDDESHQAISSYFLGPRAENYEYFKKKILEILEAQRDARLDYFPKDGVGNYIS